MDRTRRAFITSKARRRKDPVYWDFSYVNDADEVVDSRLRLADDIELGEIAAIGQDVRVMTPLDGEDETGFAMRRLDAMRGAIRKFLHPESHALWDAEGSQVDVHMLSAMMEDAMEEFTGVDPTRRASSSTQSSPTGIDGNRDAQPEESTPGVFQPTAG